MIQEKFTAVEFTLDSLSRNDLVHIWNEYCSDNNYPDNAVEDMDSFDDLMCGSKPSWIAERIYFGKFNPNDDFWGFNGYGNLISYSYLDDENCPLCISDMVDWFIENYRDRDEYLFEEDLETEFLEYINKNLPGEQLTLDEIKEMNEEALAYDVTDIIEDDWDMWLDNVKAYIKEHTNE